jgi:hypothetical protein
VCVTSPETPAPETTGQYNPIAPYITLEQAAHIMQQSPEQILQWIDQGVMLCYKPARDKDGTIMIHQSEMDRFRHPWKHIWRLDDRLNGIQGRLETHIKRVEGREDASSRLDSVETSLFQFEELAERLDALERKVNQRFDPEAKADPLYNRLESKITYLENRIRKLFKGK